MAAWRPPAYLLDPWHGFRVSGFGAPAGGGFWVSDLPQGLGFGFRVLGTAGGQILESELSKNREISSWSEAELQLSFIFAKKNTGRTPSHLWYFGQRCCFWVTSPIFFRLTTTLNCRYIGARAARGKFLDRYGLGNLGFGFRSSCGGWVLGFGAPVRAGFWVSGSGPETRARGQSSVERRDPRDTGDASTRRRFRACDADG